MNELNSTEVQFLKWLKKLESQGLIKDIQYGNNVEPIVYFSEAKLIPNSIPKNINVKNAHILREASYKPDFVFKMHIRLEGKLFYTLHTNYKAYTKKTLDMPYFYSNELADSDFYTIYVDTKPSFVTKRHTSSISFPIKVKALYDSLNVYINKVIMTKLVKKTFSEKENPRKYITLETWMKKNNVLPF